MEESSINFTRVEEDPFAKIPTENITAPSFHEPSHFYMVISYLFFAAESINFFLGIASVISDILIVYYVFRYKRLRKNSNLYIANYAIMNLCFYVVAPVLLLVHILLYLGFPYFPNLFCYVSMMEYTFLLGSFIFATLLGIDWTISILKPGVSDKFRAVHKFKYPVLYILIATLLVLSCIGCLFHFGMIEGISVFFMPCLIITLVYVHYIRRKKVLNTEQLKTEYALWVFTIAVGCFIPIYLLDVLSSLVSSYSYHTVNSVIFLCEYILSFLSTPSPVFILYYLTKWNKHFKMAFDITFKRSVRTYGADNLDDASDNEEIVEDEGQKNVQSETNGLSRAEILVP